MFKIIVFIKRKPGRTLEEFIEYYENNHAPLGLSKLTNFTKYARHYLRPYGNDAYPAEAESPYDVLTEIWFENEEEFQKAMAILSDPEKAAPIWEDEEKLFDRSSIKFMVMEDHETDLKQWYTRYPVAAE